MNEGDNKLCKFSQVPEKYKRSPELKHAIRNEKKYLNTYQTFQGAKKSE